MLKISKKRDLSIIQINDTQSIIISCDAVGGIGLKTYDSIKLSPDLVAYYTARVALMEILSVGASLVTLVDTLSVEMEPTGEQMIKGIRRILDELQLDQSTLNGSTEDLVPTVQTGIGVTAIGISETNQLKIACSQAGDAIYLLGIPKIGSEISYPFDSDLCSLANFKVLVQSPFIHEIIPIGSKGIAHEARVLAELNDFHVTLNNSQPVVDIQKAGGPASCVIFTMPEQYAAEMQKNLSQQITKLGYLY